MRSKSENQVEPDQHSIPPATVYAEPWWRGVGYNTISPVVTGGNASNSSSMDGANGSESNDGQSMSNGGVKDEEEDAKKESQTTASSRPDLVESWNPYHVNIILGIEDKTSQTQWKLLQSMSCC